MSNNASNQTNHNVRGGSDNAPSYSRAEMEAAAALVALSQDNRHRNLSSMGGTLIWDVRTNTRRPQPIFEGDNGRVNPFAPAQNNSAFSTPASCDFNAMLAERLWTISLVHLAPPQIELASERSTAGAVLPEGLQVPRTSETPTYPEELGRFIDLWDAHGYTGKTIGQMLFQNHVFFSHSYINERTGHGYGYSEGLIRSLSYEEPDADMGDTDYGEEDEEEEEDEEDELERWENPFKYWYDAR